MDGSQQIAAASADSSRNVVTSISNGVCAARESNLTPSDRNICLRCARPNSTGACVSQVPVQRSRGSLPVRLLLKRVTTGRERFTSEI